jgi:hypothetical protein
MFEHFKHIISWKILNIFNFGTKFLLYYLQSKWHQKGFIRKPISFFSFKGRPICVQMFLGTCLKYPTIFIHQSVKPMHLLYINENIYL